MREAYEDCAPEMGKKRPEKLWNSVAKLTCLQYSALISYTHTKYHDNPWHIKTINTFYFQKQLSVYKFCQVQESGKTHL